MLSHLYGNTYFSKGTIRSDSLNYNNPVSFFTESQTAISSILGSVADTATIRSLIFYLYNFTNALSLVITLSSFGPRSSSPTQ